MRKKKRRNFKSNFIPYSKKLLIYSRIECWVMTAAIFVFRAFRIDTEDLYQIVLAGWAGYAVAKALYYNMAKSDHQIQLLIKIDEDAGDKVKNIIVDDLEKRVRETISQEIKAKELKSNEINKEE